MELKERLLNARNKAKLTQRQAEANSGISRTSIFRYEQGSEIGLIELEKLANVYNVSPIVLAGWEKYITTDFLLVNEIEKLSESQKELIKNLIQTLKEK